MPTITMKNDKNSAAITWLAKTCDALIDNQWPSEKPVIYDGSDFREDSHCEANHALLHAISQSNNIRSLTLKNMNLTSADEEVLKEVCSSNFLLHTLVLCNISSKEQEKPSGWPNAIFSNLKNLKKLTLERCRIDSNFCPSFRSLIQSGSLNSLILNKLDLVDHSSSDEFFHCISEGGLDSLEIKNMNANRCNLSNLFEYQKNNTQLTSVVLTRCEIGIEESSSLAKLLTESKNITSLNLSENNLCEESIRLLTRQGLKNNASLKTISLSHNPIGDGGAKILAEWLCENQTLKTLRLVDCDVWGPGCTAMGKSLKHMKGLRNLIVDSEWEDHVDVVLDSMESNMSLMRLTTDRTLLLEDPRWEQVEFYLKLNRAKRRILVERDVSVSLWPKVLSDCGNEPSLIFHMLQHKPDLVEM